MNESITSYFQGIFIISLTGTVTEALISASCANSKTLESGLKLVFSLCLLLSVIIPTAELLKNTDFFEYQSYNFQTSLTTGEQNLISSAKKQMENEIQEKIYERFGINPSSVCIDFVTEESENSINVDISRVTVSLPHQYTDYHDKINDFAKELLGINSKNNGE